MNSNIGNIDRGLRIAVGLLLLSYLFWGGEDVRLWGLIGLVPLLTAFVKFCPAYWITGIRTCK